ncbi:MAG: TIGR04255 family protein, partial [Pseudomonadota bacterium]
VHLANAPLIRVLAQVRFPPILKIREEAFIADFQEYIRKDYPRPLRDVVQGIDLAVSNDQQIRYERNEAILWRFFDRENITRVSLGTDFISMEVASYQSRQAFLARMKNILSALSETIEPSEAHRVGFRYVSRVGGDGLSDELPLLIRESLLGAVGPHARGSVRYSMTEVHSDTLEGQLAARIGLLSPGQTHDPNVAPPVDDWSWIMDIDGSSRPEAEAFDPHELIAELEKCAGRAYSFFRWSVKDLFLEKFGRATDEN